MTTRGGTAPSQRQLRVGEEIRHALAMVIERGDLRDPGLHDVSVTITEARATPDLKHVQVYIMPLGGGEVEGVLKALNRAKPYLRRQIAKAVHLKYAPDLHFREDESFDNADHISKLLRGS